MKNYFAQLLHYCCFVSVSLEAGINNYNISEEEMDLVIKRISSYDKNELIERKLLLAVVRRRQPILRC